MNGAWVLLTALLAQSSPSIPPTTQPSPATAPVADGSRQKLPMNRMISLSLEENQLVVKCLLPPTDDKAQQYEATDWPGELSVQVGDGVSLGINLQHMRTGGEGGSDTLTDVITRPDYIQISRGTESADAALSVTFMQAAQFADEDHNPTRLIIEQSFAGDRPKTNLKYTALNLAALRQEHPVEVGQYLVPIFRDLGAPTLLNEGARIAAWQALAPELTPDPEIVNRVGTLLRQLEAPEFSTRAKADQALTALGPPAALAVERSNLNTLGADARGVVDLFLARHHPLKKNELETVRSSVPFLLDTALIDDPQLRKAALDRIETLTGKRPDLPESLTSQERQQRIETLIKTMTTQPSTGG